jgi:hypothetical protein
LELHKDEKIGTSQSKKAPGLSTGDEAVLIPRGLTGCPKIEVIVKKKRGA